MEQLLKLLDLNSKLNLRATCTYLFEYVDHRDFVVYFTCSKRLPEMVKVFSRYQKPISLTFAKTIELCEPKCLNYLSTISYLTKLELDEEYKGYLCDLISTNNSFKQLAHITLTETKFVKYIKGMDSVFSLELPLENFSDIPNINQLTSLVVRDFNPTPTPEGNITTEQKITALEQATNLKSLKFRQLNAVHYAPLPLIVLTALESLHLVDHLIPNLEYCTKLTRLVLHELKKSEADPRKWTTLTNLQILAIRHEEFIDLSFITALKKLCDYTAESYPYQQRLDIIRSDKLTSLNVVLTEETKNQMTLLTTLENLTFEDYDGLSHQDYEYLSVLTKLTRLDALASVNIESFSSINNLSKLKEFKFSVPWYDIPPTYDFFDLSQLPNLESLDLLFHTSEAFERLRDLTNLTHIETNFELPENAWGVLQNKEVKVLKGFRVGENEWPTILKLTTLETLIVGMEMDQDEMMTSLMSLTALKHLTHFETCYVATPKVHYKWLTGLTTLQRLKVPQMSPKHTKKLTKILPYLFAIK